MKRTIASLIFITLAVASGRAAAGGLPPDLQPVTLEQINQAGFCPAGYWSIGHYSITPPFPFTPDESYPLYFSQMAGAIFYDDRPSLAVGGERGTMSTMSTTVPELPFIYGTTATAVDGTTEDLTWSTMDYCTNNWVDYGLDPGNMTSSVQCWLRCEWRYAGGRPPRGSASSR